MPKKNFLIDRMHDAQLEFRTPQALEFIAHYLDRIDSHLERLAEAAERLAAQVPPPRGR